MSKQELTSIGQFRNDHGELFVVLVNRHNTAQSYITGDETGWEPVRLGFSFNLSDQEVEQAVKIVKEFFQEVK